MLVGLTYAVTLPGQSSGIMLFVSGLKEASKFNDMTIGVMFLIATILTGAVLSFFGNIQDRIGERKYISFVCIAIVILLLLIASSKKLITPGNNVFNFFLITSMFFSLRSIVQGCLHGCGAKLLAKWFVKRGLVSIPICIIFSVFWSFALPEIFNIIKSSSWEAAYQKMAQFFCFVGLIFWLLYRDAPEKKKLSDTGMTLKEAKKVRMLWLVSLTFAIATLASTGTFIHMAALFESAGKNESELIEVVQWMFSSTLAWLLILGPISDKLNVKMVLICVFLTASCTALGIAFIQSYFAKFLLIAGLGGTAATYTIAFSIVWPKIFGTAHLAEITGYGSRVILCFSGFSPFCFEIVKTITGSYSGMGYLILMLIGINSFFILTNKTQ